MSDADIEAIMDKTPQTAMGSVLVGPLEAIRFQQQIVAATMSFWLSACGLTSR